MKVGLDDFFVAGGTKEELIALSSEELRPASDAKLDIAGILDACGLAKLEAKPKPEI